MECGRRRIVINIPVPDAALWKGEPRFVIIAGKYRARNLAQAEPPDDPVASEFFTRERPEAKPRQSLGTLATFAS